MREFLKAPVVFGHPNQNRFSIFVRPQLVISRGFSSTSRKWTKKWTSQIPPNKNTQPGTDPHLMGYPIQCRSIAHAVTIQIKKMKASGDTRLERMT